jgi:hypothetical protein
MLDFMGDSRRSRRDQKSRRGLWKVQEWWSGAVVEWWSGGVVELAEWWSGGVAK